MLTVSAPIYSEMAAHQLKYGIRVFTGIIDSAIQFVAPMYIERAEQILENRPNRIQEFGGFIIRTDPMMMDGHDALLMLHASLHYVPDEEDRLEIKRLVLQVTTAKYSPDDIETLRGLLARYIPAIARELARSCDIGIWEYEGMLSQRLENGSLFASPRVDGKCDLQFDREQHIEITTNEGEILVRCSDPRAHAMFGEYQQTLYVGREVLLSDLVSDRPRMINGVLTAYEAIRFPETPTVAQNLIDIARRYRAPMIDLDVHSVAYRSDHDWYPEYAQTGPQTPGLGDR